MIWNPLKSLKPWQVLALFVVVLAAAGATYGGYLRAGERESTALEESQQIIPIRYGNLVNEVSTSGNLAFPDRVTLSFGSGGSVAELAVEEGTPVSRGQVLARLDDLAIASLAEAKAKAELSRLEAVEALEEAMTVDPLAIAEAQENIAAARLAVQEAEEALEDARNPHTREDIEKQRQLAADTELQLQNTRQALADMATAHETQLAKAREAVAAARFDHEEARRKLEDFAPSHNLAAIAARQSVADAEADLDAALQSLADFDPNYARSLALARQEKADAAVGRGKRPQRPGRFPPESPTAVGRIRRRQSRRGNGLAGKTGSAGRPGIQPFPERHPGPPVRCRRPGCVHQGHRVPGKLRDFQQPPAGRLVPGKRGI